jgi:transposase InsO family protein
VATAEPELEAFQVELRAWETVYNTVRPHQALGYPEGFNNPDHAARR